MFCCPVFIHILYRGVIMDVLKYGAITLLSITAIIIIIFAMRSGKPLKSLLINAMLGIAALAVVDITTRFPDKSVDCGGQCCLWDTLRLRTFGASIIYLV